MDLGAHRAPLQILRILSCAAFILCASARRLIVEPVQM